MSSEELEDDKLDLSAWDAPEPPENLADAVIARMGGSSVVPRVADDAPRPRRRTWMIAGVAAACLALTAGTYALIRGGTEAMGPASGSVIAERARTLSLGRTRVELDPGARVSWKREGNIVRVEQPTGTAAWRVGGEDMLVIDAGATVASVEASSASLRVEVKMNQTDAKVMGGAAVTAAVVSLVSVVVYEGYVKVGGSKGQPTVIVQPGSTYTVAPPPPPVEPPVVGATPAPVAFDFDPDRPTIADVRLPAGESATIHAAQMPVFVEIEPPPGNCTLVVDGEPQVEAMVELTEGGYEYYVDCPGSPRRTGELGVEVDDFSRPLAPGVTLVNHLKADGRMYQVTFQDEVPAIEITGGTGTLHLMKDGIDRTFTTNRIESGQLGPGHYQFWFETGGKESDLVLDADLMSPMLYLSDVRWNDDQTQITGAALAHSVLSVRSLSVPLLTDGRFMLGVSVGNVTTLRAQHAYRGVNYFVLRAPKKVATGPTTLPQQLDTTAVMNVMNKARARLQACGSKATSNAQNKFVVEITVDGNGKVSAATAKKSPDVPVSDCVVDVVRTLTFPRSKNGVTFSFPLLIAGQPACDAQKFHDKAIDNVNMGQYAAAHAQIEAALRCKPGDANYLSVAFMTACQSQNEFKAKHYYAKLPKHLQTKFAQICIRNKVAYESGSGTCDAQAHVDDGMTALNEGNHATALSHFEDALTCKPGDGYVRQLAFMSACNAGNEAKAQTYYDMLSAAQKTKFRVVCTRNKIDLDDEPASAGTGTATSGYLQVFSKPQAKILIDGVDTGLTTPISGRQLPLVPGKHKVTFVIDDDRFTYPVTIKAGGTETLSKDLQ